MANAIERWGYVVGVPLNDYYDPDLWEFLWESDQDDGEKEGEAEHDAA